MIHTKSSLLVILTLLSGGILALALFLSNTAKPMNYSDLRTVLTTTTATFGSLLGIITAGLMFTHGKFSELASELSEKAPDYLSETLSLEKMQQIGTLLLTLRKTFLELEKETTIVEEKSLYRKIVENASSMFVNSAVLLSIKLQQQGLRDTDFIASEMDPPLYRKCQETRKAVRKEWQIIDLIKKIVDTWEGTTSLIVEKPETRISLQSDIKSAITILKLKEKIDKNAESMRTRVTQALENLRNEIGKIGRTLHEDRIPQLLSQMNNASTIRGKYFYLALVFIATPLFVNLVMLPQYSEETAHLFQPVISATSSLSVMGVAFLLLYIHKILSV
jgi:hypothetical protein